MGTSKSVTKQGEEMGMHPFVKLLLFIGLMLVPMIWSVYFVGPSGQRTDVWAFIVFWLREIIWILFFVAALILAALFKLREMIKSWLASGRQVEVRAGDEPG